MCRTCGEEKLIELFYRNKKSKDGRLNECGSCNKEKSLEYGRTHSERKKEISKKWYQENSDKVKEQRKEYRPRARELSKQRYAKDPEFRQRFVDGSRAYRANPENKEKIKETRARIKKKKMEDPKFRITMNLRRRMNTVLTNYTKDSSTIKLVGCTWDELRAHIEHQFTKGMSWENYGRYGWHLDHIKGCAQFDLSDPNQQKECFHYTNLQPLWWQDNLRKGDMSMEDFNLIKRNRI